MSYYIVKEVISQNKICRNMHKYTGLLKLKYHLIKQNLAFAGVPGIYEGISSKNNS